MERTTLARRLRRQVGILSRTYNIGRRWSKPAPQPASTDPLPDVRLFAVLAVWCEEDIISSTVSNAFAQGCERVYIIDNDSPDGTLAEAIAAGAEVAKVYKTAHYDEAQRMAEIRAAMDEISPTVDSDHVWWLTCDGDEFPHGPAGLTLREYLSDLDRRFRVVGARVFNHYPSAEPANVPGRHPLDFQPLCQEVKVAWCSLLHYKHPLVRWDRYGPPLWPGNGFHRLAPSRERVAEPTAGVFLHHFQFREREVMIQRLRRQCEPSGDGLPARSVLEDTGGHMSGAKHRLLALDDVYAGRWDRVPLPSVNRPQIGVDVRPWQQQVSPTDALVRRWYTDLPSKQGSE